MATYSKDHVIYTFESLIRERTALPAGIEDLWFDNAVGNYSFEIKPITYDTETCMFGSEVDSGAIMTIVYIMKVMYLEREMSRVNKINNIITKDISLNGNGDTKKYTHAELMSELEKARDFINKSKTTAYGG